MCVCVCVCACVRVCVRACVHACISANPYGIRVSLTYVLNVTFLRRDIAYFEEGVFVSRDTARGGQRAASNRRTVLRTILTRAPCVSVRG